MKTGTTQFSPKTKHFQKPRSLKISFLGTLLLGLFLFNPAYCEEVDSLIAKTVARNFYVSKLPLTKSTVQESQLTLVETERFTRIENLHLRKRITSIPVYYIFNVGDDQGYIIISGDDRITPVLGYSYTGHYEKVNQPPAREMWMEGYKNQIIHAINEDYQPDVKTLKEWQDIKDENSLKSFAAVNDVEPLLGDIEWSQGCNYNRLCPDEDEGPCNNAYVGCTATAMGQVMKKWEHPYSCSNIPGYTDPANYDDDDNLISASRPIPGISPTVYDWTNMPDHLVDLSLPARKDAVSELLYHCGVSAEMDYGPDGSGASYYDARNALENYFSYASTAKLIRRNVPASSYYEPDWVAVIRAEIDNDRPVLYSGYPEDDEGTGHAFICDGYQDTDFFHFNWGWDGSQNDYFYLDDLTPGTRDYSFDHWAVVGIMPDYMDPCSNISSIYDCNTAYAFGGGGTGAWNSSMCGYPTPGREQVYSFVAPVTGTYSIEVMYAEGYMDYGWRSSSCGESGWNCIGDINSPGIYGAMSWTAGTTYYILLDDEDSAEGIHQFYIICPEIQDDPELEFYSREIDDDSNNTSSGNDDGYVNAGESIEMPLTLRNTGGGDATNVSAVLSSTNSYIYIDDDREDYADISAGSNMISNADFDYTVASSCPQGNVTFTLNITSDEGSWTDQFSEYVYAAPANNPCDNIIQIGGCSQTYAFSGGGTGAWDNSMCGYSTPGQEQVYSFVAPETGTYSIEVISANGYMDYGWRSSSCSESGWNCIQDVYSPGTYGAMSWTAGTTYYILLDDENTTEGVHQFYINCPVVQNDPDLEYYSLDIDDDNNNTSSGNNNGLVDAGESIELPVTLRNTGDGDALNVSAVLSCSNSYITITDPTESLGTISSGSTATTVGDFDFTVDLNCPQGNVTFTLNITSDEGSWTDQFNVYVYAAAVIDPCDNIISIYGCNTVYAFAGGGSGSWNNNMCDFSTPGREQIYSFTAPETGVYQLGVISADGYIDYGWRSSSCGETGWNCISDVGYPDTYGAMSWTAGTTYYILLDDENDSEGIHQFFISCPESNCEDNYESNNTLSTAYTSAFSILGNSIYNSSINGTIDEASDEDYYRINVSVTGTLNLELPNPPADYNLEVLNSAGQTVAYASSSGGDYWTYEFMGSETGYYYIHMDGNNGANSCTQYDLNLEWIPYYVDVTPDSRPVGHTAGSTYFSVSTNVAWDISENETWLNASETSSTRFDVTYDANTTTNQRTGYITVTAYGGLTETVTVVQEPEVQSDCEDTFEPNNSQSTATTSAFSTLGNSIYNSYINGTIDDATDEDYYRINVSVTGTLNLSVPNPPADYDLELLNAAGQTVPLAYTSGGDYWRYEIMGNETGYYYIHMDGNNGASSCTPYNLNLEWIPYYVDVTPDSRPVSHVAGSTYFSVSTNVAWNIGENETWLNASETSATRFDVTYDANTTTNQRTGYITVTAYGGLTETVTVVQEPEILSDCEDSYEPNNSQSTAATSAFGSMGISPYSGSIIGTIHEIADEDYYRINITTVGTLYINSTNPPADFDLELLNAAGTIVDYSRSTGSEYISYEVNSTGYYYIHVYGNSGAYSCTNYNLNLEWIPSVNLRYDYLIIDDNNAGESNGDGDGLIEPGETIELIVWIHNDGPGDTYDAGLIVENTNVDRDIQMWSEDIFIGFIPAGESRSGSQYNTFTVDEDCPEKDFTLTIRPYTGYHDWYEDITLHVNSGTEDPCNSIIAIGGSGQDYTQTFTSESSTGIWDLNLCGYEAHGTEQVYSFVAPKTGTYAIELTATDDHILYGWATSCNPNGWNCIGDLSNQQGSYGSMNWTGGTTYYILLKDLDNASDTHQFYISSTTAIGNTSLSDNIMVYPNPTRGKFILEIQNVLADRYNVQIVDPAGKVVWVDQVEKQGSLIKESIDLSASPAGLYFIKVSTNNSHSVKKIILAK